MVLSLLAFAPSGFAQDPSQPVGGLSMTSAQSVDGRITSVDANARLVTVAMSDGRTVSGKVSESVGGLDLVKPGDRVHAVFEETVSFVLSGPNTATPTNRAVAGMAASGPDRMPAGVVGSKSVSSWLVVATSVADNTISLVEPAGGQVHTFTVRTPEGRAALPRVMPGDKLTVVHIEFVFAGVMREDR
ncbi:hypothetical protein [Enhydrobacter sp.]|jgi:hypothetical protein|uniref:hypothetical protein n=1 Tax=Enhydrobacter sp. TaxID=1894999 RepID=UPI002636A631|nr:hypothetical protein [Enhydrobacter sp.]